MTILILFAFLAGVVTVLSPCILPLLPIILSSSIGSKHIGYARPFGVVLGFVGSFTFFTLFLASIVRISGVPADTMRYAAMFIIGAFGISLLVPRFQLEMEKLFSRLSAYAPRPKDVSGLYGGLCIGFSVGLLWTPCVGPILASVISLALAGDVTKEAFFITVAYATGTAIPMFLIMLGGQSVLRKVPYLIERLPQIQKLFGVIMILTAMGLFYNVDKSFQTYILDTFPHYGESLTGFEDVDSVRQELESK